MRFKSGPRRHHSLELEAKVLAACDEPGASISGIALAYGLNTNLRVHVALWSWHRARRFDGRAVGGERGAFTADAHRLASPLLGARAGFVAIEMPTVSKMTARADGHARRR